ncbi:MAG: MBL fold metallo-hydrolase [Candidatus Saccharimonadales bacterium]
MKITKYEHACFGIETHGKQLLIDPGNFTTNTPLDNTVSVLVLTHEHPDHCDGATINALIARSPDLTIVGPASVVTTLQKTISAQWVVATPGDSINLAPFSLRIFGGSHAVIHPDIPQIHNIGVMINNTVYYPGDSFTIPDTPIRVLALPVSAPWLRIRDVIDYVRHVAPSVAFPTHDAILSKTGKHLIDSMLVQHTEAIGTQYKRIDDAPLELE